MQSKPTVGRIVHIYGEEGQQPLAAIITYVHNDACINVAAFDTGGSPFGKTSVLYGVGIGEWSFPERS